MSPKPTKRRRTFVYKCADCGADGDNGNTNLLVKRAEWRTLGTGGRTIHSRAIKWQCRSCAALDPEWQREAHMAAPGLADIREKRGDG